MVVSRFSAAALVVFVSIGTTGAVGEPRVKSGTGFYVSPDGYAITTSHVLDGCERGSIAIWGHDRVKRLAKIIDDYEGWDIALLKADVRVATVAPPAVGSPAGKVFVLGYGVDPARPLNPHTTEGSYRGQAHYVGDPYAAPFVLRIHARLKPGDSGGAVVGEHGGLIGMVQGRFTDQPDIGVILPSQVIVSFLSKNSLRLPDRAETHALRPWEILDSISVLVQCSPHHGGRE